MTPATDAKPGWDEDGMCNDHGRFCCEECAISPQDTEAASQPREGEVVIQHDRDFAALLSPTYAASILAGDMDDTENVQVFARYRQSLTQRPPEQAGAVPAGVEQAQRRLRFIAERYGPGTSLSIRDINHLLCLLDYVRSALTQPPPEQAGDVERFREALTSIQGAPDNLVPDVTIQQMRNIAGFALIGCRHAE